MLLWICHECTGGTFFGMHQYTEFVFFYPASQNYVPVCSNVCELFTVAEPLLRFIKVNACHDIALLTHVCHIGRADLNEVHHYASSHPISTKLMSIRRQSSLVKRNLGAVWMSGRECFTCTSFRLCQWPMWMQHSMLRFGMYWSSMIRQNAGGCMASVHRHIHCTQSWGFIMLKWQGKFVVSSCAWQQTLQTDFHFLLLSWLIVTAGNGLCHMSHLSRLRDTF